MNCDRLVTSLTEPSPGIIGQTEQKRLKCKVPFLQVSRLWESGFVVPHERHSLRAEAVSPSKGYIMRQAATVFAALEATAASLLDPTARSESSFCARSCHEGCPSGSDYASARLARLLADDMI